MAKIQKRILNADGPGRHSSSMIELATWDGFGSFAIAQTLRVLMHPFDPVQSSIRIQTDVYKTARSVDFPSVQYEIWDVNAYFDGKPIIAGQFMIHKGFPGRSSRPAFGYTYTGAVAAERLMSKKDTR